jgi:hypothetical protein
VRGSKDLGGDGVGGSGRVGAAAARTIRAVEECEAVGVGTSYYYAHKMLRSPDVRKSVDGPNNGCCRGFSSDWAESLRGRTELRIGEKLQEEGDTVFGRRKI